MTSYQVHKPELILRTLPTGNTPDSRKRGNWFSLTLMTTTVSSTKLTTTSTLLYTPQLKTLLRNSSFTVPSPEIFPPS